MKNKTHYRKVFKSDHLGVADLEDMQEQKKRLIFTIKEVKQEIGVTVAGRIGNHNIAYFKEKIKPLVLNSTNSKVVKSFCGNSSFIEDWTVVLVELYIDPSVKMKGDIVGGVRIRTKQPSLIKPELTPNHPKWASAKKAISNKETTVDAIKNSYTLSNENADLLSSPFASIGTLVDGGWYGASIKIEVDSGLGFETVTPGSPLLLDMETTSSGYSDIFYDTVKETFTLGEKVKMWAIESGQNNLKNYYVTRPFRDITIKASADAQIKITYYNGPSTISDALYKNLRLQLIKGTKFIPKPFNPSKNR